MDLNSILLASDLLNSLVGGNNREEQKSKIKEKYAADNSAILSNTLVTHALSSIINAGDFEEMKDKYVMDRKAKNNLINRQLATTAAKVGTHLIGNAIAPGLGSLASTVLSPFIDKLGSKIFTGPMKKAQDYQEIQNWINQVI